MMGHQEGIQFYVRYYYSTYYDQYSKAEHLERFLPLAEAIQGCFEANANVQVLLQHILDNMMNMAMKVYSGELSDNDETRTHFVLRSPWHQLLPISKRRGIEMPYKGGSVL